MIIAEDFAIADQAKMPTEAGTYLCMVKVLASEKFTYAIAKFYPKEYPDKFIVYGNTPNYHLEVMSWVQIENSQTVAEQLGFIKEAKAI